MKWFSENVKFWNITFSRRPLKIFSYNAQMKAEDMLHQSVVTQQVIKWQMWPIQLIGRCKDFMLQIR